MMSFGKKKKGTGISHALTTKNFRNHVDFETV